MKTRKFISLFLALALTLSVFMPCFPAFAEGEEVTVTASGADENYEYNVIDGTYVEITKYIGDATEVVIPAEIEGLPVEAIGNGAFSSCKILTSVEIPSSVKTIGDGAFAGCSALTNVEISEGVTSFGYAAFGSCSALTSVTIPDSVTELGTYMFASSSNLKSIVIGNGAKSIPEYMFAGCISLTDVTIGSGIETIERYAFVQNEALEEITIPSNVKSIGEGVFASCKSLKEAKMNEGLESIGINAFASCRSLETVIIPDSVTTPIYSYMFANQSDVLTTVKIGNGVKTIEAAAFANNKLLTSLTIGNSVETIGKEAFTGCSALETVVIPESVTAIPDYAFAQCYSLNSITIPASVETISSSAFNDCGSFTMYGYEGSYAETYANKYSNITFVAIEEPEYEYTIVDGTYVEITKYIGDATEVVIPAEIEGLPVEAIGNGAFGSCRELVSVEIPGSVKTIGDAAFASCSALTNVEINEGVTSFGYAVFGSCVGLKNVVLPDSVTELGTNVFASCSNLKSIVIGNGTKSIPEYMFAGCISLTDVTIGSGVETIERYAFVQNEALEEITIPSNVKSLGEGVFASCKSLKEAKMNEGLESIGINAFASCRSLETVIIPDSVTTPIYSYMFANQSDVLTTVKIGNGVKTIEAAAFANNKLLTSLTIGNSVETIGKEAFTGCSALETVVIPESVTAIPDYAFAQCYSLNSITIPASVETISSSAFNDCGSFTMYGYEGSYAEIYANKYSNITFVAIEEPTPAPTVAPTTSAPTEAPSRVYTRAYIEYVGNSANTYITNNGKLPANANLGHGATNMAEVLGAFAQYVVDTNNGLTGDVAGNSATVPEMMYEDLTEGTLTKAEYVALAQSIIDYIAENGEAPAFLDCGLGALSMNTLVRIFAKVVATKKATGTLPETVEVSAWFEPLPVPPEEHATEFEDTYVIYAATSQLSYLTKNNKFSAYSTLNGEQVYQPELLGLFAQFIVNKNEGYTGATSRNDATFAENSYENITGTSLTKAQYVKAAQDVIDYIESSLSAAAPGFVVTEAGTLSFETLLRTFATVISNYKSAQALPETVEVSAWTGESLPTPPTATEAPEYQTLNFLNILKGARRVVTTIEDVGYIPTYVTLDAGTRILPGTMLRLFAATVSNINRGKATNMPLQVIDTPKNIVSETLTAGTLTKLQYIALAQRIANVIYSTDAVPTYVTSDLGTMNYCNMIYMFSNILKFYLAYGFLPDTMDVQPWGTYDFQNK